MELRKFPTVLQSPWDQRYVFFDQTKNKNYSSKKQKKKKKTENDLAFSNFQSKSQ